MTPITISGTNSARITVTSEMPATGSPPKKPTTPNILSNINEIPSNNSNILSLVVLAHRQLFGRAVRDLALQ